MTELDFRAGAEQAPSAQQQADMHEIGEQWVDGIRRKFVDVCLELEGEQLQWVAAIDAYADARVPAQRGNIACRATHDCAAEERPAGRGRQGPRGSLMVYPAEHRSCCVSRALLREFRARCWNRR